jgi:hypothetical protein
METMTVERASERDREYFRRLGKWKAEVNAEALREHLSLPALERIRRSERLHKGSIGWANTKHKEPEPRSILDEAKRLGLYRS